MTFLWWHWLLLGLVLMVAELATPGGFYLIFFGIAAVIVGLLASVELGGPAWTQLLLFSVISVSSLLLFRNRLLKWFQWDPQTPSVDLIIGEIGTATEDLAPGQVGRVELRGTSWTARNRGAGAFAKGTRVRVVGVDGLTLFVESEGAR
jgi:membrane protein implicated in regulation of membrane protease activity